MRYVSHSVWQQSVALCAAAMLTMVICAGCSSQETVAEMAAGEDTSIVGWMPPHTFDLRRAIARDEELWTSQLTAKRSEKPEHTEFFYTYRLFPLGKSGKSFSA